MNAHSNFTEAYLKSLNLVKQDEDAKEEENVEKECGDQPDENKEVVTDDVDEEEAEEDEASDDEIEVNDSDQSEGDEEATEEEGQGDGEGDEATCFCFKTINKDLIDIINSGFDKVVFTVKATDDDGKETTTDVEISADAFEDFGECEEEGGDEGQEEISDDDLDLDGDDEEFGEVEDGAEDSDEEEISFESVFKKYYNSLISEEDAKAEEVSEEEKAEEEKEVQTECDGKKAIAKECDGKC